MLAHRWIRMALDSRVLPWCWWVVQSLVYYCHYSYAAIYCIPRTTFPVAQSKSPDQESARRLVFRYMSSSIYSSLDQRSCQVQIIWRQWLVVRMWVFLLKRVNFRWQSDSFPVQRQRQRCLLQTPSIVMYGSTDVPYSIAPRSLWLIFLMWVSILHICPNRIREGRLLPLKAE